ncbi:PAS domain-containing sensor histidine kinase [Candidatus Desulfarcum epimagneticum]|uniref:histidine kinase n=1 Tax=uncultured Desulfobacteraceae bacterium TaxID=218296 RepID=A0A484HEE7_9BACT|nr:PAS domain-containing sensor histidine kinase [uncultured Desulfobacteraceae bacterium]
MDDSRHLRKKAPLAEDERRRRKREYSIIIAIFPVVAFLTFVETRIINFGADFPVSNTIFLFILININLLLLILLIFLVLRNLVKLLFQRRKRVMGARLRARLVAAFVSLTLLPAAVLFFFSINIITTSIEFWFNVPVEQALENSINVGRRLYEYAGENSRFYMEKISRELEKANVTDKKNRRALSRRLKEIQRGFNIDAIEIYSPNAERIAISVSGNIGEDNVESHFAKVSADHLLKDMGGEKTRSFSESLGAGEVARTIGTIPFGASKTDARAFIVLDILIPLGLSRNMDAISKGFEEYQQIKFLKRPVRITYYITLSIVALLVVFCAVWFGFYLAKTISIPIMKLAEGTRRVAEGDLDVAIEIQGDDEIGTLVDSFNQMTRDLRAGRKQLELSAGMLKQRNIEIEERRRYMEVVLKNISAGVISLDSKGLFSTINKSAERMLGIRAENIAGRGSRDFSASAGMFEVGKIIKDFAASGRSALESSFKTAIAGTPKSFLLHINALNDDAGKRIGMVLVFDDLTELEKAERMAAWREVARRIAHEVKNPLTPIKLSAQRLRRKYSEYVHENNVFDECTRTIIDHVDLIKDLVNEFSSLAKFPSADPRPCDLTSIIEETVSLYREGRPGIVFKVDIEDPDIPVLNLDRRQIKQAMLNLVDNAIAAVRNKGTIMISASHDRKAGKVILKVSDDGAGISPENKARLFEPDFSTKKSGMGLGLTIVSAIIADHKGKIYVARNEPRGATFVIEFPV